MIEKRWICAKRDIKGRFFEILLPILVVAFVLLLLQVEFDPAGPALELNSVRATKFVAARLFDSHDA